MGIYPRRGFTPKNDQYRWYWPWLSQGFGSGIVLLSKGVCTLDHFNLAAKATVLPNNFSRLDWLVSITLHT
jgi:hypothetical protein